jgi:hypothetical protein
MKKVLNLLGLLLIAFSLQAQVNIVDTFATDVYKVYTSTTFRSAQPKGETYINIDASARIGILQQSGAQVTQYTTWQNYRLNGQAFSTYQGAIDSLGAAIGSSLGTGGGDNFANSNLTFDGDRVHSLDTFSVVIRQAGSHGFQLGADLHSGMLFPLPNLKFSGFTGSNASDSLMTWNGLVKGLPGTSDVYIPVAFVAQGDPFGDGGGKLLTSGLYVEPNGFGGFNLSVEHIYTDNILGVDISKLFESGDYYVIDAADDDKVKWKLGKDGSITHDGAYSNIGYVTFDGGGSDTIPDNVSYYIYDPDTTQATATIALPENPVDGQALTLLAGGTVTTGVVVTSLTIGGNGNTILGALPVSLTVGKILQLRFFNGIWYAIDL